MLKRQEIKLEGQKISYLVNEVDGPVILILHGWGGAAQKYEKLATLLSSAGYGLVIPDLPGFGDSQRPPIKGWTLDDYVKIMRQFTTELKLKNFYLYAHSFGGRVALKWLAEKPTPVKGAILVGAAGLKQPWSLKKIIAWPVAKIGKIIFLIPPLIFVRPLMKKMLYGALREKDYVDSGLMKNTFKKVTREDLRPILSMINTPVLIIWGKHDKYVPLKYGKEMANGIAGAKFEVIETGGHGLHLQQPAEVADLIGNFIIELEN